jgi:hypothetical protein
MLAFLFEFGIQLYQLTYLRTYLLQNFQLYLLLLALHFVALVQLLRNLQQKLMLIA